MKTGGRSIKFVDNIYKVQRKRKKNYLRQGFKVTSCLILALFVVLTQAPIFSAFEAHIINVTAKICNYSEIRSMGYWKNHPNVYLQYLPQYLGAPGGDEIIDTQQKVNQVFLDYNLSMRNKLRGQLLAMKFNIAHFGIGEYLVESEGKTLNQIVAESDDLLRQDPPPPDPVLEEMKDLLDYLNNLHQIRYCSTGSVGEEPGPIVDIVINEFLPNPAGYDNAPMPDGEWVELYNMGNEIDVAGWVLYDSNDAHELLVIAGNTNTGSTLIGTGEFLVVYRNGDSDFTLNNVGGDTVRLYDGEIGSGANLIDSYTYTIDALEGKSFARIPDGSDNWVDPVPTPGEPNILGDEDIVFGPALPEPDEEISEEEIPSLEENLESQEEQSANEEPVVEPVEDPSSESETPQPSAGGGGSETQPPNDDGVDSESQAEEESAIDETPATEPVEEQPPTEEVTGEEPAEEEPASEEPQDEPNGESNQEPATFPENDSGNIGNNNEAQGNDVAPETGSSDDSSDEGGSTNTDSSENASIGEASGSEGSTSGATGETL